MRSGKVRRPWLPEASRSQMPVVEPQGRLHDDWRDPSLQPRQRGCPPMDHPHPDLQAWPRRAPSPSPTPAPGPRSRYPHMRRPRRSSMRIPAAQTPTTLRMPASGSGKFWRMLGASAKSTGSPECYGIALVGVFAPLAQILDRLNATKFNNAKTASPCKSFADVRCLCHFAALSGEAFVTINNKDLEEMPSGGCQAKAGSASLPPPSPSGTTASRRSMDASSCRRSDSPRSRRRPGCGRRCA